MQDPLITERELAFQLYEVLDVEALCAHPRFADHDRGTFEASLHTAREIARDRFLPHNRAADLAEPRIEGGRVVTVAGLKEALAAFHDAGLAAATFRPEAGGAGLPWTVGQACMALCYGANIATAAYPMLTMAGAHLLETFGSAEQKGAYLDALLTGRSFATMCLSEPDAGSSLADIRTRATPVGDGRYAIAGNKMWISGGEHELSENILHFVLARIDGAPAGVKGISLFIVPRYRLDAAGRPGEPNDVALAGLNHKMGYRGTVNTVLNFGEDGGCVGELVGEPHRGLMLMFQMMNEARIAVGLGAVALAYAGFRHALAYARERRQGRLPGAKDPAAAPVPLIAHADVRRMLLAQKAIAEGALALGLYCAHLIDRRRLAVDAAEAARMGLLLEILTPVMKAWSSQYGLVANDHAIQVLGGYGYTRDHAVEQLWRDNRLNPIHEGTNGIQALDLIGRKVSMQNGAAFSLLLQEIAATVDEARPDPALRGFADALQAHSDELSRVTDAVLRRAADRGPEAAYADAAAYLELCGHVVIAWMWLRQADSARRGLAVPDGAGEDYYRGKLQACRYFYVHELPGNRVRAERLSAGEAPAYDMQDAWF